MINRIGLDLFRERLGFNPYHFWGWADAASAGYVPIVPVPKANCNGVLREHPYQALSGQLLTREEIRQALADAEQMLCDYLHFPIVPRVVTETVTLQARGGCHEFATCLGHVGKIGEEKRTVINAAAAVTYSDSNGDGLIDRWAVSVNGTYSADEIEVEFVAGDLHAGGNVGTIGPVGVGVVSGVTTLTGNAWTMARPVLYEGFGVGGAVLDPRTTANYAQAVKVTRHWIDTSVPPVIVVDQCAPNCGCEATTNTCCTDGVTVTVSNKRLGIGMISGCVTGNKATLTYEAGVGCEACGTVGVDAVMMLATALLKSPCGSCADAQGTQYHRWQEDKALRTIDKAYLGTTVAQTPFGTKDGAIRAWELVKRHALSGGVKP